MRLFLSLIFLLSIPLKYVFAEKNSGIDNMGESGLIIEVIVYLALVLFLIYLLFWLLKKNRSIIKSNVFNHLGGLSLGQNKSIQIVEIGNKIYILGIGDNINLVNIIENNDDLDYIKESIDYYQNKNGKLTDWLKRKFSFNKKNNFQSQFENELTEKIEQLKDKRTQSVNQLFDENSERNN